MRSEDISMISKPPQTLQRNSDPIVRPSRLPGLQYIPQSEDADMDA